MKTHSKCNTNSKGVRVKPSLSTSNKLSTTPEVANKMTTALNLGISTTPVKGATEVDLGKGDLLLFFSNPEIDDLMLVKAKDIKSTMRDLDKKFGTSCLKNAYKASKNAKDDQVTVLEFCDQKVSLYYRTVA